MTARASLLARRDELNRRFATASPRPEPDVMMAYLARTALPILDACDGDDDLVTTLFDLGLRGARLGLVGAAAPSAFEQALVRAVPGLAALGAPSTIVAALGNGLVRLATELGRAPADRWLDAMVELGPRARTREELLALGLVLAWRAGLAEARVAALAAFQGFAVELRRAVFPAGDPSVVAAERFVAPGDVLGDEVALVGAAGGFVGFGGPFARPPRPAVVRDRVVCTDGDVTCELHADAFGARLVPAPWAHAEAVAAPVAATTAGARVTPDGRVQVGARAVVVVALVGASAVAAAQGMIAVTLADSHKVFVVGRPGRRGR